MNEHDSAGGSGEARWAGFAKRGVEKPKAMTVGLVVLCTGLSESYTISAQIDCRQPFGIELPRRGG
jgi:hypothetical protein